MKRPETASRSAGRAREEKMSSVIMNCGGAAGPVTGMPFSAQELTEKRLVMPNGSISTETLRSLIARDAEGRSWRQMLPTGQPPLPGLTMISDPIAGYRYLLHPDLTAIRSRLPGGGQLPGQPSLSGVMPGAGGASLPSPGSPQQLGERMIEGFLAKGTRYTTMVPPGITGATQPIQMVTESWCAKDLGAVLHNSYSDPRVGEITTRLTGIQQAHPPSNLFQVPSNYRIVDAASKVPSAPHMPSVPSVPSVPNAPSIPAPNMPSVPQVPSMPNLPSAPSPPSIPSMPNAPSMPSAPSVPSAPSLPSLHTKSKIPGL